MRAGRAGRIVVVAASGVMVAVAAVAVDGAHTERTAAALPDPLPDLVDFDGNGAGDLVVGMPGRDYGEADAAGQVRIMYGPDLYDLEFSGSQVIVQPSLASGSIGDGAAVDAFGSVFGFGDFDGDGYTDLAIGVPYEDIDEGPLALKDAGVVHVLYGGADGLRPPFETDLVHRNRTDYPGEARTRDLFGASLMSGDFDGDGYADLAIGAIGADVEASGTDVENAGEIDVIHGSADGLDWTSRPVDRFTGDDPADHQEFGTGLSAGDFDGDGLDDLAVGVPGFERPSDGDTDAGRVELLYGADGGLARRPAGQRTRTLDIEATGGVFPKPGDRFGRILTSGDFDGDGRDDLAVGVPEADLSSDTSLADAGLVQVFPGSPAGPDVANAELWHQNNPVDVPGVTEATDLFGEALTTGYFDDDDFADLAIGIPGEAIGVRGDAGYLTVIYGSASGLDLSGGPGVQAWNQDTLGDDADDGDEFGLTLAATDFDGNGIDDLAAGSPLENLEDGSDGTSPIPLKWEDSGMVEVVFAEEAGLDPAFHPTYSRFSLTNSSTGGIAANADLFGAGLGGQFARRLWIEVAGGTPGPIRNVRSSARDGALTISFDPPRDANGRVVDHYLVRRDGSTVTTLTDGPLTFRSQSVDIDGLENGTDYTFEIVAVDRDDVEGPAESVSGTPQAALRPLEPARLLESRIGPGLETVDGVAEGIGLRSAGSVTRLPVTGRGGVDADASAVYLNVAAVGPVAPGYLTVFPCGTPRPLAANVNYLPGRDVPNAVLAKVGDGGEVCIYTLAATHLVIDVNGWVPPDGSTVPIDPARYLETRTGPTYDTFDGEALGGGKVAADTVIEIPVGGRGAVPSGAATVFVNVAAVDPDAAGFLTVYGCHRDRPLAANLNYRPGEVIPNAVLTEIAPQAGTVCIYTRATTHIVVDVSGYVEPGGAPSAVAPARLLETRQGDGLDTIDGVAEGIGRRGPGSVTELVVAGRGAVPAGATAALLNVAAVLPGAPGYVTAFPCGVERPLAANLNYRPGDVRANAVLAQIGDGGKVCLFTLADVDLVVDVNGYIR